MFDILPMPDLSKLERIADLFKLRDHLLSNDEKTRFVCLYYYHETQKYCTKDCEGFIYDHSDIFGQAGEHLVREVDTVKKEHFIAVLRTFFCGDHDPIREGKRYEAYKVHFEKLWEGASRKVQSEVWDALRKSGRGIYPPSTPGCRSAPKQANSAPTKVPEKTSMAAQGNVPSLLNVDSDTPSRPRTSQASLGSIAEPSEDDLPVAPPTPTPGPGCIPISGDICTGTPPPSLLPVRSKSKFSLFGQSNQMAEDSKYETIWDALKRGTGTKVSFAADSEVTENGKQSPVSTPQTERWFKGLPKPALKTESEPQATWSPCPIPEKLPVAPEHGRKNTLFGSPTPFHKDLSKSLRSSPIPESLTMETDPPLSENTSFRDETPGEKHSKAAISPAQKRTPKPCAYERELPGMIASMIRDILRRDIEERTGAVYVLQAPEFFSNFSPSRYRNEKWVKIGISSDVKSRLKNLEANCGITNLKAVHVSHSGTMRMNMLWKIEALCHAELNNFRRRMDCENNENSKCNEVHEEWFAVEPAVAIRTVKRWTRFLHQNPYSRHGGLNEFWRGRLEKGKYCEFDVNEGDVDEELVHRGFDAWFEESIREKKESIREKRESIREKRESIREKRGKEVRVFGGPFR